MPYKNHIGTKNANGCGSIRKRSKKRKNGTEYVFFEARYTVGRDPKTGKQVQKTISGPTLKEVREKLNQALYALDQNEYVDSGRMTVADWMESWLTDYAVNVKPSTKRLYEECIRLYINPHLGKIRLDKLDGPTIQRYYNDLHQPADPDQKPISAKSVKNVHGILHKALQQAVKNGMIRLNPTESCVLPRIEKKEIMPLTQEQIQAFLELLPGHPHEYLYQIAMFTGMREGELLGLPWDCVDFKNNTILVKQQLQREHRSGGAYKLVPTKNDKKRVIPMAPTVVKLFELQRQRQDYYRNLLADKWEETGLVFTGPFGGYLSYRTVYDCFKRLVKKIGAPNARVHDLRHTYAVACIESGVDVKTLQENLGHATAAFTMDVYGHVSRQMQLNCANKLETFIQNVQPNRGGEPTAQGSETRDPGPM